MLHPENRMSHSPLCRYVLQKDMVDAHYRAVIFRKYVINQDSKANTDRKVNNISTTLVKIFASMKPNAS